MQTAEVSPKSSESLLNYPPLPSEPPPAQPPAKPAQSTYWGNDGYNSHDIPPISALLLREADAWRAVLSLHASVVTSAQQVARTHDGSEAMVEDRRLNTNSREAAYCAALSALAAQCDNLYNELLKIRALRKARRTVEVECSSEIIHAHADEILAIGQNLASSGAVSVGSATADLRLAIQAQRNQVTQLRVFLETLKTADSLPLPSGTKIVVGARVGDEEPATRDLDDILKDVYTVSRELTDSSLSDALSRMFLKAEQAEAPNRNFARRAVDREQEAR